MTQPAMTFDFTFTIEAPDVTDIRLNGSTVPLTVVLPVANAGQTVAAVTVTTRSGAAYTTPLELSGMDAGKFALSHGGVLPCFLLVGAIDVARGAYSVKLTAP